MAQKQGVAHIALVASRPDDAASPASLQKVAHGGAEPFTKRGEEPPVHSLRQTTLQTADKTKLREKAERQSQEAHNSERIIRAELTKQAMLAIEYCPEIASAWQTVQKLPRDYQNCFLQLVGAKPQLDAGKLTARLLAKYRKELRPYGNDEANNALAHARTISAAAEAEFMMVYDLLGEKVKPAEILRRIEAKFGPTQQTRNRQKQEREARDQRALRQKTLEQEARKQAVRDQKAREQKARERKTQEALEALKALEAKMQEAKEQAACKRKGQEALDRQALQTQEARVRKAMVQEVGGRYSAHLRNLALPILLTLLAATIYIVK